MAFATMRTSPILATLGIIALAVSVGCADNECPAGFSLDGKVCRRVDAGSGVLSGDSGNPGVQGSDASTPADGSTTISLADGGGQMLGDAAATSTDASGSAGPANDAAQAQLDASATEAGTNSDAAMQPAPECDAAHACAAGLVCSNAKCVSACTQTQCDPNATCSLVGNAPTCTCNRGYTGTGSGTAVTCTRNPACDQLGCDPKASCEGTQETGFQCRCISGYTGDGKTCSPVTCDPPAAIANFMWPSAAVTYGSTITGSCNPGYQLASGNLTLLCGADKKWVGTTPSCKIVSCSAPEPPRFPDGTVSGTVATPSGLQYNSTARYSCSGSLSLNGDAERTCGANGQWSGSAPKCLGCGDQVVQKPSEQCDPTASGWNFWTCSSSCVRTPTYNFESCTNAACPSGLVCSAGVCMKQCGSTADCPLPPVGLQPVCASTYCYARGCSTNADCAPGLVCLSQGGSTVCSLCSTTGVEQCSSGTHCVELIANGSVGKCQ